MNISAGISTGKTCPVTTAGKDEAELEKRLDAALIKSQPIFAIDNVNGLLFGNKLAQAVEQRIIDVRPLGTSDTISVENNSCVFATGCNISVRSDMVRRTLMCRLDPEMEEPFGVWGRFVQRPLIWLGKSDPAKSVENSATDDPESTGLHAVLSAWHRAVRSREVTIKELRAAITEDLREAILEVAASKDGEVDSNRLGGWLTRMNGRVLGGLRLSKGAPDRHQKQKRWRVCKIGEAQPKPPQQEPPPLNEAELEDIFGPRESDGGEGSP
jgi:putative DNA primase/helicase